MESKEIAEIAETTEITKICVSYINGKNCTAPKYSNNWCFYCSRVFLPKYYAYKRIEKKYYSQDIISDLKNTPFEKMMRIYTRIETAIKLREELQNHAFNPENRDSGHVARILELRCFLDTISDVLSERYEKDLQPPMPQEDQSSSDEEKEESQIPEYVPKVVKKLGKKQDVVDPDDNVACVNYLIGLVEADLEMVFDKALNQKFGDNFLRTFYLQQKTFNAMCQHGQDLLDQKRKYKKNKNVYKISTAVEGLGHRYVTPFELVLRLHSQKNEMYEDDSTSKHSLNRLACPTKFDELRCLLILYEHMPHVPLTDMFEFIKFEITDELETEIRTVWKDALDSHSVFSTRLENKIRLLKTKKEKNTVCLNNCMRACSTKVLDDEQLVTEMKLSQKYNHVSICTAKQKKKNPGVNLECTQFDDVDFTNFKCLCSHMAIIKISRKFSDTINNWNIFAAMCTGLSPYIFL